MIESNLLDERLKELEEALTEEQLKKQAEERYEDPDMMQVVLLLSARRRFFRVMLLPLSGSTCPDGGQRLYKFGS